MPVDASTLSKPIDWTKSSLSGLLSDLQANILKGHGRDATKNIFLQFDSMHVNAAKKFVNDIGKEVTSALIQLQGTANFKSTGVLAGPIVLFFLTAKGFQALGLPASKTPSDAAFQNGMSGSQLKLNDPPKSQWDTHFGQEIHALLLIADAEEFGLNNEIGRIRTMIPSQGVRVLGEETGIARRNSRHEGIEHFGYVDGRSQPLMLQQDVSHEENGDGTSQWDPRFGPDQVLVKCPGGATNDSFGSYFVFRKLEQKVQGFKIKEQELADAMGLVGEDRERAGALVVGRFEDGTPIVMHDEAKDFSPVPNNFNYANDPNALRCPFQGHIRKSNPRGESATKTPGVTLALERSHIMARRGITYGKRYDGDGSSIPIMPNGNVGLLFMAYQKDISNQFEFTQQSWVNDDSFVASGAGTDPVIGQSPNQQSQKWRTNWDRVSSPTVSFGFQGFVTLKGGEYFFAPSISCLKNI
jgi:Dyp-type peroxidase family